MEDALELFKKEYNSFLDSEINMVLCNGENLIVGNKKNKTIEELKLNENSAILFYIKENSEK